MLRRADRDAPPATPSDVEARDPLRPALDPERTVAPREHRLEHRARGGGARAPARPAPRVAREEVADRHARGLVAGLPQRERARQVARHPVVPERRDHAAARGLGARAVLLEHPPDERRLAGRVEVVRAREHRGLGRGFAVAGERADGREEHIASLHERLHGVRARHVGHRDLEPPEFVAHRPQPLDVARREHRAQAALHHRLRRQAACVSRRAEEDDPPGHCAVSLLRRRQATCAQRRSARVARPACGPIPCRCSVCVRIRFC